MLWPQSGEAWLLHQGQLLFASQPTVGGWGPQRSLTLSLQPELWEGAGGSACELWRPLRGGHCPRSCPSVPWVTCIMALPGLHSPGASLLSSGLIAQSQPSPLEVLPWAEMEKRPPTVGIRKVANPRLPISWALSSPHLEFPLGQAGVFLMPGSYPFLP